MSCVCGEARFSPIPVRLLLLNSHKEYPIVRCVECKSAYFEMMPTPQELADHYSENYNFYTGNNPKQSGRGVGFGSWYLTPYRRSGAILDVGCGAADFLKGIRNTTKWAVTGCDINSSSVARAISNTGIRDLYDGGIFDSRLVEKGYDCIHLRDVIEHVVDPVEFLRRAADLLAGDGFVYVRVPNGLAELNNKFRVFKKTSKPVRTAPGHLWYFSPKGFEALCSITGFEIEKKFSFGLKNGLRDWGIYPVPKVRRNRRPKSMAVDHAWCSKTDKAAKRFVTEESRLWKGISLLHHEHVYILRK